MEIRRANSNDIDKIVELLKLSLGESQLKKTKESWIWKHEKNPFGKSPVLVAIEDDKLVGVRAMMQWEFKDENEAYKSLRAVDTATHPEYQGRGIFKKLTLKMVEEATQDGFDFIFNTPNSQSSNGYIKMGWEKIYKIPVRLKLNLIAPFHRTKKRDLDLGNSTWPLAYEELFDYWEWRFMRNPFVKYFQISSERSVIFFRIKEHKRFNELRICDARIDQGEVKLMRSTLSKAANHFNCLISTSGIIKGGDNSILKRMGFFTEIDWGLTLYGRRLNRSPLDLFERERVNLNFGIFELF